MEFHVMDEAFDLGARGCTLFLADGDADAFGAGSVIRDVRGNAHTVTAVGSQDGVGYLLIGGGDAAYFARLLRDVRVDATRFTLAEERA